MKLVWGILFIAAVLLSSANLFAGDGDGSVQNVAEIAVIGAHPDFNLDFAQQLITTQVTYIGGSNFTLDYGTQFISLLDRRGVQSVASLQVLDGYGQSNEMLSTRALEDASRMAKIVLFPLGPKSLSFCNLLKSKVDNIFVVVAETNMPYSCKAPNIVNVAGLDKAQKRLADGRRYNPDALPDVAAPSVDVKVIGLGGRYKRVSNLSVSVALVGARIALVSNAYPDLSSAELVAKFYENETIVEDGLLGTVANGRRLDDDGE